ncbi:MAG TPA: 4Fe-4S dicluster domain-containing protein [Chloroflexota bacterium]|nr:4Fe-4S dicluster domain-containing protein [Chloroflexota bacterium]
MTNTDQSLSLTPPTSDLDAVEKVGLAVVGLGLLALLAAAFGAGSAYPLLLLIGGVGGLTVGALLYFKKYLKRPAGIDNDGLWFTSATARGALGWVLGIVFTGFYVLLYWFPETLAGLVAIFDPVADLFNYPEGLESRRWIMYGSFYTLAILVMGVRMLFKYRHSRYHMIRTVSVMFFQLVLAFLIPYLLVLFNQPEFYFSYFWPLKYDYLWPGTVGYLAGSGGWGVFMVFWGAVMIFLATPILTYFFGKRWYCSWVCGCGGLAETAGDPFRHLSDKSLKAWQIERWLIHSVLVFVVVVTAVLWINSATEGGVLGGLSQTFASWYGFVIGLVFSGVIGVGFYPIMGSRVWCRFGCPMAAILGIQQKFFSRFRITTNGGQCISCGNCSTYCEMGIDVRWYAQRGQNVIRASCVGCGVCAAVCPRGVLKLENGPREGRYNGPALIAHDDVTVMTDERWDQVGVR